PHDLGAEDAIGRGRRVDRPRQIVLVPREPARVVTLLVLRVACPGAKDGEDLLRLSVLEPLEVFARPARLTGAGTELEVLLGAAGDAGPRERVTEQAAAGPRGRADEVRGVGEGHCAHTLGAITPVCQ